MIEKLKQERMEDTTEERYAYYRRCRVFRRNGHQCKAPAMKGEHICYKHAEQAAMRKRWERQRRELLSRPGVGFGDFRSIQRTLSAAAQALIDGTIDVKVAGWLAVELQTAARLLRMAQKLLPRMNADQRRIKEEPRVYRGDAETRRTANKCTS